MTANSRGKLTGLILALILASLFCRSAIAAQTGSYSAKLNASALQANQTAVIAVVVDIAKGYHAQSHEPLEDNLIKFEVQPDPIADVEFLDPVYPKPTVQNFAGLGKQSVYTDRIIVYLPLRVKADAKLGDVSISGRITWQACDESSCFAPERNKPFRIATRIVSATESVSLENADLFSNFDQSIFAKGAPPIAAAPILETSSTEVDFFGHHFALDSLAWALPVALAVGLLFNLMPCVLPVVPLKILGFVKVSENSRARCFLLGTVFSLGVVSVFALLAQFILVSHWLQWGELFGRGWFIWPMVIILVALALGQFGLFDVIIPNRIYELSPSHETLVGNYLFGMLTALLSTPCTAPMFAGLLAWSLKQPRWAGEASIYTVGVGMALPYLVLSAFPNLARWVPRSGPWSAVLKQMMGFLVLAVAVYFAGGRLSSNRDFIWAVFAVMVVAMIFLTIRTAQLSRRFIVMANVTAVAIVVIALSLWITLRLVGGLQWQAYSPTALDVARASGKTVLVEFTANWCGNCLALEGSVYHDPRTAEAIHRNAVILLRADLTASDAPGWPMVNQLNPGGGIPLTAIYGPHNPDPIKLTSLYTTQNLIDAIQQTQRASLE